VDHFVSLSALQDVLGKYNVNNNLLISGGPLAATGLIRAFISKNKAMSVALAGSTAWFAVKELAGPVLGLVQDQFGNLESLLGSFR